MDPSPERQYATLKINGIIYVGEIKDGQRHGVGKSVDENRNCYEGEWAYDERQGFGTETLSSGEKYQGHWHKNKRDGHGICIYPNGNLFEGEWRLNEQISGKITFNDGGYFDGEWKFGLPYFGTLVNFKDSGKYFGQVSVRSDISLAKIKTKDVKRHGRGAMFYPDGSRYFGYWKDDHREGFGIFVDHQGNKFIGNWIEDQKSGHGFFLYSDGTRYEGEFEGDAKVGREPLVTANGDSVAGDWRGNSLFRASFLKGTLCDVPEVVKSLLSYSLNSSHKENFLKFTYTSHTKWKGILSPSDYSRDLYRKISSSREDFKSVINKILQDEKLPFGKMIDTFVEYFNWMYQLDNIAQSTQDKKKLMKNPTFLPLALDDIHSFLHFARVTITKMLMLVPKHSAYRTLQNILSELIFPKIYVTLFQLYKVVNRKKEILLLSKFFQLQNVTVADIGIKEKFWLRETRTHNVANILPETPNSDCITNTSVATSSQRLQNEPYAEVIDNIQMMVDQPTPARKIQFLLQASDAIVSCVDRYYAKVRSQQKNVHLESQTVSYKKTLSMDVSFASFSLRTTARPPEQAQQQQQQERNFEYNHNNPSHESDNGLHLKKIMDDCELMRNLKSTDEKLSTTSESNMKQQRPRGGSVGSFALPRIMSTPLIERKAITPRNTPTTEVKNTENHKQTNDIETTNTASPQMKRAHSSFLYHQNVIAMGAEDKFPILIYAIIKSGARDLVSNLHFLSDFCTDFFIDNQSEAQYRIIEMKSAIDYIMSVDVNLRDTMGCLVPLSYFERQILDVLKELKVNDVRFLTCVGLLLKKINGYQSIRLTEQEQAILLVERDAIDKIFGKLKMVLTPRKKDPSHFKVAFSFHFPVFLYAHIGERMLQFSARRQYISNDSS